MATTQITIPHLHHLTSSQSHRVLWALEEIAQANPSFRYRLTVHSRQNALAPPELKEIFPLGKGPILTVETVGDAENEAGDVNGEGEGNVDVDVDTNASTGMPSQTATPLVSNRYQILPGVLTESRLILQFLADNYSANLWTPSPSSPPSPSSTTSNDLTRDIFFQEFANSTLAARVALALVFDAIPPNLPPPFRQIVALLIRPVVKIFVKSQVEIFAVLEDNLSDPDPEAGDGDGKAREAEGEGKGKRKGMIKRPWFSGAKMGLADINMSWGMDMATALGYFEPVKFPKLARWRKRVVNRPAYQSALKKGGVYDLVNFK